MPGIAHRNDQFSNGSTASYTLSANGFWSKHADDVSYNQLQKVLDSFFLFMNEIRSRSLFCNGFYVDFDGSVEFGLDLGVLGI